MRTGISQKIIGRGVYGGADTVRLVNFERTSRMGERSAVSRHTIFRWLRGYDYISDGIPGHSPALWTADFANDDDDGIEVSFRDLIELRFVRAFRSAGVSLGTIRRCYQRAVDLTKDGRPFSTSRFRTDGATIFAKITADAGDGALMHLKRRQLVFQRFVEPSLKDLEFEMGTVARWYPLGARSMTIILDPDFSFGRPITAEGRIPTETLARAVAAERSIGQTARLYGVRPKTVRDALLFEQKLAA